MPRVLGTRLLAMVLVRVHVLVLVVVRGGLPASLVVRGVRMVLVALRNVVVGVVSSTARMHLLPPLLVEVERILLLGCV